MQYIMAGRHNSLPVCHVEGNGFKWFQKGVLTGLDGLQSEMCKVQMHLFFFLPQICENTEVVRAASSLCKPCVHCCV